MYSISPLSKSSITISWDSASLPFLQSIQHVIPFTIIKSDNSVDIMANTTAKRIGDLLFDYDTLVRLAECISRQIIYMEKRRITFIGFDLSDILCIGKHFIVANYSRVVSYTDSIIYITRPFVKPTFGSPEMLAVSHLPSRVSYETAKYGLGALIVSLIGDIADIKYTKLYWFVIRCFSSGGFVLV